MASSEPKPSSLLQSRELAGAGRVSPTGLISDTEGPSRPKTRRLPVRVAAQFLPDLLIIIAVLAIYYRVHHYLFFSVDDPLYITSNAHVRSGLNWNTVPWAATSREVGEWHPVTWLSHALDCQIFGVNPSWHHDMNMLFHALNAVVLWRVLKRATLCAGRSFVAAMLFAVHPLNVEPVVWVAERKTLLATLFFLLALDAYRCYVRRPGEGRHWLVAVLFALGLMCKPQVIMLPFVLLLWDYWPLGWASTARNATTAGAPEPFEGRSFVALVRDKLFLFALAAVAALFTMAPGRASGHSAPAAHALSLRIGNAVVSYALYVGKAFWPSNLAFTYPYPPSLPVWKLCAALTLLLVISALVVANWCRRYLTVGWLWFLVTLAPMIGVVEGPGYMADRYAYISFIGLFIMASWGVSDLAHQGWPNQTMALLRGIDWSPVSGFSTVRPHRDVSLLPVVSAAIVLALTVVAHHQVGYWENEITIWSHNLQVTPNNWFAERYMGITLESQNRPIEAIQHLDRALTLKPNNSYNQVEVAFWEHQHGSLIAAIEHYKKALSLAANGEAEIKIKAATNLGYAYRALGDVASSNEYFAIAVDESKKQEGHQ